LTQITSLNKKEKKRTGGFENLINAMKKLKHNLLKTILLSLATILIPAGFASADFPSNPHYGHWVYLGGDITWALNLIADNPNFIGIKKVYNWRDLEPSENVYDFSEIESDLAEVQAKGKRLWIQPLYVQYSDYNPLTPTYMWGDTKYGGNLPYCGNYKRTVARGGWLPIVWNPEVQARFQALFAALGARFNNEPYIEGIIIDETSTGVPQLAGETEGYSSAAELEGFKIRALAAKNAFPDKAVIQQINFASFDREDFGAWCVSHGIGIGTPDFTVHRPDDEDFSPGGRFYSIIYPMMLQYHEDVPIGPEVQWADYEKMNPETGEYATPLELLVASRDLANPWYFFWEKREPWFTDEVIPTVNQYPTLPITRTPSGPGVIDNGDTGTSFTGKWYVSTGPDPYGTGSLYSNDPDGIYIYEKALNGNYNVSMWWTSLSKRPDSAIIKIYNDENLLDTKTVNQKVNGGQWNLLGNYYFNGNAKIEILSNGGDDYTCADAVKFVSTSSCTENWQCTSWSDWSKCTNNRQSRTRTCTDANNCGTTTNKPAESESQSCESPTTYGISNFIQLVADWLKSEPPTLESDVNGDGVVNTRDLGIMMSNWSN